MRWLLALSLAACSTWEWEHDDMTDQTRPVVVERLESARGEARLVVSDRYYIVRDGALQTEIRAVLSAVADEVRSGERCPPYPTPSKLGPVVALPRLDRALSVSDVAVERIEDPTVRYIVTVERDPRHFITAEVRPTTAIDGAFDGLVAEAKRQAVLSGGHNVGGGSMFLDSGVDIRGTGGLEGDEAAR